MTLDLRLQVFGKLTPIQQTPARSQKSIIWQCQCQCGELVLVPARDLVSGNVTGHRNCSLTISNRPLASIWKGIQDRCYNSKSPSYKHYGGRGIAMSIEWRTNYFTFESDMGERPSSKHSIDRIDVNGNYCKENCRWATSAEQAQNKRALPYDFELKRYVLLTMDLPAEIVRVTGLAYKTVCNIRAFSGPEKLTTIESLGFTSVEQIKRARITHITEIMAIKNTLQSAKL